MKALQFYRPLQTFTVKTVKLYPLLKSFTVLHPPLRGVKRKAFKGRVLP